MSDIKVLLCEDIHPAARALLAQHMHILTNLSQKAQAEAIISRNLHIDSAFLQQCPQLRVIAIHGTGTDGVDLAEAKRRGVVVFNTPGTNANAVAEMIAALTLALARKVCQANAALQSGQCPSCAPAWLQGVELRGKTLGLLGTGTIACRAAAMFQNGFGMQVVAWSPSLTPQRAHALGMQCAPSMDEVLAQADVLSLGMSLNDETRGILGAPQLAKMKKSAFLINTARGALVDEAALYHALATGALAGAASDVFVHEPPAPSNPLLHLPNFIATPHIAANTEEALLCTGQCVVQGLLDVLQGCTPPHCLT